jgi:lipoprotein-anchoring transpeptidase ErfK/SrfK
VSFKGRFARALRALVPLMAVVPIAACSATDDPFSLGAGLIEGTVVYASLEDRGFIIPAVYSGGPDGLNPAFARREVSTPGHIPNRPGTIVVDTPNRYLYFVMADNKSIRYGIGVGREGFAWAGEAVIKAKQAWPTWTPPPEMLKRDPSSRPYANGMPGGMDNPLGARALYLFQGDKDTLYRVHGTSEPWTIGQAVSSGCVRLLHQDIIDLYNRTPIGTKVIVLGDPSLVRPAPAAAPAGAPVAAVVPPASSVPAPEALFPGTAPTPPEPVGPA